jgi:biopolymer transport protein ExbD
MIIDVFLVLRIIFMIVYCLFSDVNDGFGDTDSFVSKSNDQDRKRLF